MIDNLSPSEPIHVLRTETAEYISVKPLAVNADNSFPVGQVIQPLYITSNAIVIGSTVHVVGGQLEDLLFGYDEFVALAESGYFSSVTGDEAQRLVDYLRVKFSVGQ